MENSIYMVSVIPGNNIDNGIENIGIFDTIDKMQCVVEKWMKENDHINYGIQITHTLFNDTTYLKLKNLIDMEAK